MENAYVSDEGDVNEVSTAPPTPSSPSPLLAPLFNFTAIFRTLAVKAGCRYIIINLTQLLYVENGTRDGREGTGSE